MNSSILIWILVLSVFTACSSGEVSVEGPSEESRVVLAPGEAKKLGDLVPAAVLASDYELDYMEADSRYKGKVLRVPGLISEIGISGFGIKYIALSTGWEGTPIQCMFEDSEFNLSNLSVMQKVVAAGTIRGLQDSAKVTDSDDVSKLFYTTGAKRVTMSECTIVE